MTPDANFESISYNLFIANEFFFNSESDPNINSNVYSNISPLDTNTSIQTKFMKVLNVLHLNLRSIKKIRGILTLLFYT